MNPKAKKALIISGVAVDFLLTIALFVFSICIIVNVPHNDFEAQELNPFLRWFADKPIRIVLLDVLPLCLLLVVNMYLTFVLFKKTGTKKKVTLNDLSDEEKEALRKKILQEMLEKDSNK